MRTVSMRPDPAEIHFRSSSSKYGYCQSLSASTTPSSETKSPVVILRMWGAFRVPFRNRLRGQGELIGGGRIAHVPTVRATAAESAQLNVRHEGRRNRPAASR